MNKFLSLLAVIVLFGMFASVRAEASTCVVGINPGTGETREFSSKLPAGWIPLNNVLCDTE